MLKKLTDNSRITGSTKVFGIVGDPVAHSFSPHFWNKAFEELDLDAVYIPFKVCTKNLENAISGLKSLNVSGINVTRPHKKEVAAFCEKLYAPAEKLQAVNSVDFSTGKVQGWNTDATGFLKILSDLNLTKTATVFGNGASAQAIFWALLEKGFDKIFVIARNKTNSIPTWASEKEAQVFVVYDWSRNCIKESIEESSLVINTTPLGWENFDEIEELEYLDSKKTYIDLNYSRESKLIEAAKNSGARTIDGRELLLNQGLASFKLLTGYDAPEKVVRNCIYNN